MCLYARYERYDFKYQKYRLIALTTYNMRKKGRYCKKSHKALKKRDAIHDRILRTKKMRRF